MFESLDPYFREDADSILGASDAVSFFSDYPKRASNRYRQLARQFHPDRFAAERDKRDAETVFKALGPLWDRWNRREEGGANVSGGIDIGGRIHVIRGEAENLRSRWFKAFLLGDSDGNSRLLFAARAPYARPDYVRQLARIGKNGVCADLFRAPSSGSLMIPQADGEHLAFTADIPD